MKYEAICEDKNFQIRPKSEKFQDQIGTNLSLRHRLEHRGAHFEAVEFRQHTFWSIWRRTRVSGTFTITESATKN